MHVLWWILESWLGLISTVRPSCHFNEWTFVAQVDPSDHHREATTNTHYLQPCVPHLNFFPPLLTTRVSIKKRTSFQLIFLLSLLQPGPDCIVRLSPLLCPSELNYRPWALSREAHLNQNTSSFHYGLGIWSLCPCS